METKQEMFIRKAEELVQLASELNYGDPFASGRMREIILAQELGHTIHHDLHGEDAKFLNEESKIVKVEYKTNFEKWGLQGRYDVSWQPTWQKQVDYLESEKIANKEYHYFATFSDDYKIVDIYQLTGRTVLDLLLPSLEKNYKNRDSAKKNQGLYSTLGQPTILKEGKLISTTRATLSFFV